jgi:threonine aldolase
VIVDLRSDTVTKPTPEMRRAMADAEVGDDVWGDDPTVNRLQRLAAAMVGKEAALFTPSGTMANQIAIAVHTRPGAAAICGLRSHVNRHEMGGAAANCGVQLVAVADPDGRLDPAAIAAELDEQPLTSLVCLEDTHGGAGGRAVPAADLEAAAAVAHRADVAVHLDGARIFNAAIALGCEPAALARPADTVMFCVSKGLGAPVGSLLCGPAEVVERARIVRRRLGGGMRQAGVLAAAGIVALETMPGRLAADHARARRLAEGIEQAFPGAVDAGEVDTNMVFARADRLPDKAVARLGDEGVLCGMGDRDHVRFVTHHQVDDAGIDRALAALRGLR